VPVAPAPPPPVIAAVPILAVPVAPPAPPATAVKHAAEKVKEKAAAVTASAKEQTAAPLPLPATTTTTWEATTAPREEPIQFLREERPAVVKEKILPVEEESIQPIIHREIEKREIHEVIQPIHERQYLTPSVEDKQLPAEVRPVQGAYVARTAALETSTVEYGAVERVQQVRPPIVEESIKRTVIECIQPVIHRETVKPHIIRQTQNIYEKILEPEVVFKETRPLIEAYSVSAQPALTQTAHTQTFVPQQTKYVFDIDNKIKVNAHPEYAGYGSGTYMGTSGTTSSTYKPYQK